MILNRDDYGPIFCGPSFKVVCKWCEPVVIVNRIVPDPCFTEYLTVAHTAECVVSLAAAQRGDVPMNEPWRGWAFGGVRDEAA